MGVLVIGGMLSDHAPLDLAERLVRKGGSGAVAAAGDSGTAGTAGAAGAAGTAAHLAEPSPPLAGHPGGRPEPARGSEWEAARPLLAARAGAVAAALGGRLLVAGGTGDAQAMLVTAPLTAPPLRPLTSPLQAPTTPYKPLPPLAPPQPLYRP